MRRLATVLLCALWLALLAGLLGRHDWVLELFSHFRVQYALLFAALAAWLLLARRKALAVPAIAGALISAVPLAGYIDLPTSAAQAGVDRFRLVSFNVWFRNGDHARVAEFLEGSGADAIVLQELASDQAQELQRRLPSFPYSYVAPGRYGAVVYSRWPVISAQTIDLASGGAPAASLVLQWRGEPVRLLGVHLHWPIGSESARLRNAELEGIAAFAGAQPQPLLVAGDFNTTPWSPYFADLISRSGLSDCGSGRGVNASWPAPLAPLGIAIDHCLASRHWRSLDVTIGPRLGSDHRPLIADLALRAAPPPG